MMVQAIKTKLLKNVSTVQKQLFRTHYLTCKTYQDCFCHIPGDLVEILKHPSNTHLNTEVHKLLGP